MLATTLKCPECGATLRLAGPAPAGKKIKCPKCSTIFPAPISESAPPRPSGIRKTPAPKAPLKRPQPIDDEDDREDDDYAEARSKSKAVRKPAPVDDYDDEDDYEEEEDEAPRRRKTSKTKGKKKKAKGGNGLLIGMIGGVLVLLLGLGAVAAWVWPGFLKGSAPLPKGSGTEDLLAYTFASSTIFGGMDTSAAKALEGDKWGDRINALTKAAGSVQEQKALQDLIMDSEKIVGCVDTNKSTGALIFRTSKPYDPKEMAAKLLVKSEPTILPGGQRYYNLPPSNARLPGMAMGGGPAMGQPGMRPPGPGGPGMRPGMGGMQRPGAGAQGQFRPPIPPGMQRRPGFGGGPGMGGQAGQKPAFLAMPNDRILVFAIGIDKKELEESILSDGSATKVPAETAAAIHKHEKEGYWVIAQFPDDAKAKLASAVTQPPLQELKDLAPVVKEIKFAGITVKGTPQQVTVEIWASFPSDAQAKKLAAGLQRYWGRWGKSMMAMASLGLSKVPNGNAVAPILNDLAKALRFSSEGTVAMIVLPISKATFDKINALEQQMMPK
jgi:hypothetical protein